MEIRTVYKYDRGNRKITVSPAKPDCDYTEMYRIIAGEGMSVTQDGVSFYSCVDTDSAEGWIEEESKEDISMFREGLL